MNIFLLTIILCFHFYLFVNILVSSSVESKKRRYSFASIVLAVFCWILTILLTEIFKHNYFLSLILSKLSFFVANIGALLFHVFVYNFDNAQKKLKSALLPIGFTLATLFASISLTNGVIKNVSFENDTLSSTFGSFHTVNGIYLAVYFLYSLLYLIDIFRRERNTYQRIQLFNLLIGILFSLVGSFITNILLPSLGYLEVRFLGPITFVFFLYFSFLAIKTYKFLEVNIFGDKLIFAILIGFVPQALFYFLYFFQTLIWNSNLTLDSVTFGLVFSIIVILTLSFSQETVQFYLFQLNTKKNENETKFSKTELQFALRNYNKPNALAKSTLLHLSQVKSLLKKQNIPAIIALQQVLFSAIESFKPRYVHNKRTASNLKYEILRMIAYEGATESQIMWELGFDVHNRSTMEKVPSTREPKYKLRDASEYAATSMRSYKRLKKEAIEMLKWKLEQGD